MSKENNSSCLVKVASSQNIFQFGSNLHKNGAKSRPFFLEIGAKMKNFLRLSQLQLNLFCMKMNLDLRMAYSAVSLTHIQNAQAISFFESWLQFIYLSWLLEYQWRIIYKILSYILDVLWGQPIKLVQVASTSELFEN